MRLTLEQLKASQMETLTPEIVGSILRISPDRVREYARTGQLRDMFPCIISGRNVKIPRAGFIRWMEGLK